MNKKLIITLISIIIATGIDAQNAKKDSIWRDVKLHDITVNGYNKRSGVSNTGANGITVLDMKLMNSLPKILGNADPMHYAQMLPGVQTNNEYDGGLHIDGSDIQHNILSINTVPVYNVTHLLGFFSVFNASHYPSLSLHKAAIDATDGSYLGGSVNMNLIDSITKGTHGEFAVGLISSQGTLQQSVGKHSEIVFSARTSYINLLYSQWLSQEDLKVRYSFSDFNFTYLYQPSHRNSFWIDSYYGYDHADLNAVPQNMMIKGHWGNQMIAGHWLHTAHNGNTLKQTVFFSRSATDIDMNITSLTVGLPSSFTDIGYKGLYTLKRLRIGAEVSYYHCQPQSVESDNSTSYVAVDNTQPSHNSMVGTFLADYQQPIARHLSITGGLRASTYIEKVSKFLRGMYGCLDPSLSMKYERDSWQASLNYSLRHQFLHQTGMMTLSMPTEFWTVSTGTILPQYAHSFTALADIHLSKRFSISAEVFYKRLYNQIEYYGQPMNLVNTRYALEDNIVHGKGFNYGFSIMLNKHSGRLSGWMSYTYTRARRQFQEPGMTGWYSAQHERPHEFDIVLTYDLTKRLSLGATGVVSSGTPFTNVLSAYYYNGNVITEYGEHNAERLKPYIRLDLSINYKLKTRLWKESGINFSLYDAQARKNEIGRYVKKYNNKISFKSITFVTPILPSISYYAKF